MTLRLTGLGTAVPEHAITQDEAVEVHSTLCEMNAERARTLRALYRRSGVERRHSVVLERSSGPLRERQSFYPPARDDQDRGPSTGHRLELYEMHSPLLAAQAVSRALEGAGLEGRDMSHVVTVSCTGFAAPGVDSHLIETLRMPATTRRAHVGFMGCHGALNGLCVADSILRAEPDAVVALCAVELCSLHFAYGWCPEMMVPNALFADGAGAVIGTSSESGGVGWSVRSSSTLLLADTAQDMSWKIGDHGFRMTLSARVPALIESRLGGWLRGWLRECGLEVADIASWAVHPGGPRIIGAVERSLGLDRSQTRISRDVLAEFGNMSSATVLFILDRLRSEGAPGPLVALALGPGLVAEAVLFV